MDAYHTDSYDLSFCFRKAELEHSNVLRISSLEKSSLFRSIMRLEHSFSDDGYASELYRQVLFLEFMIHLNRAARKNRLEFIDTQNYNLKIQEILQYVNDHLAEDLTIDGTGRPVFYQQILYDAAFQAGDRLHAGAIYHAEAASACQGTDPVRRSQHTGLF